MMDTSRNSRVKSHKQKQRGSDREGETRTERGSKNKGRKLKRMSDFKQKISIDYESELANLNDKHKEEGSYLNNKIDDLNDEIDELHKRLSIFELKWSVVEMIFRK